jgi:hypothetical protein
MSVDLTASKKEALEFLQGAATNLLALCNNYDDFDGKAVALGIATSEGVLAPNVFVDQDATATPPVIGDFGPASSVYAHLQTSDVAALYAGLAALRATVTPTMLQFLRKWSA